MDNPKQRPEQGDTPLLLPPAADYLGQWLAVLAETYRGEMTALAMVGYRASLSDLSPRELDLAIPEAMKQAEFGRPEPGDIRKSLRIAREKLSPSREHLLAESPMTDEESADVLRDIREKAAAMGGTKSEEGHVVEITDEMRERHRLATEQAVAKYGKGAA